MVDVAQSVRVVVCGAIGRGFESHLPPEEKPAMHESIGAFPFYG